jgi:CHASE2 domain-containing sensor protein
MPKRATDGIVATGAVATAVGLATWLLTMASASRYSYGADQDLGDPALWPVLLAAALVGGFIARRRPWLIGAGLGLPGLLLSPWTAPRGDHDGLWILIVPYLAGFVVVLIGVAVVGQRVRRVSGGG